MARLRICQGILMAAWVLGFTALAIMNAHQSQQGERTPWGCAAGMVTALAHGIWITIDARILNRPVGAWRFAAFFLGPIAIWLWLAVGYGWKAVFLIPASMLVYGAAISLLVVASMVGLA
jgi:hypothetical protein